jgi:hypothetical protein
MTEEPLRALLTTQGLGRAVDRLIDLAAPTVRIYIHRAEEGAIPTGASKMGGQPDLPSGVEWPSWHEPMAFIAQFNLAEVAPFDRERALPARGLLSFFYETDGEPLYAARWGLPEDAPYMEHYGVDISRSWRVLYHAGDPATFIRRDIPPGLNTRARYLPCAARFAAALTLPDVDGPEMQPIGLTQTERYALIEIDHLINKGTWEESGHHLLGYPWNMGGPTLVDCADAARGVRSGWAHAGPAGRLALERATAARWRLLLQVSGSDATEMDWAGGGVLHYCIERAALKQLDFSRVWLNMQFL